MKAEDAVHATPQIGSHLLGNSRSIGSLPSGRRIYLVPTDKGGLCVAVAGLAETCSAALSEASPATFTILNFPVDDINRAVDDLTMKGVQFERYEGAGHDDRGITRQSGPPIAWLVITMWAGGRGGDGALVT